MLCEAYWKHEHQLSTAGTVDIEDDPILNEGDVYIELVLRGLLVPLNLMISTGLGHSIHTQPRVHNSKSVQLPGFYTSHLDRMT